MRSPRLRTACLLAVSFLTVQCSDQPTGVLPVDVEPQLIVVSGDGQMGPAGVELPDPLVVRVVNVRGDPLKNILVNFRVATGGGTIYAGTAETDRNGEAADWWTLGPSGAQRVEVRTVAGDGTKTVHAVFVATLVGDTIPDDSIPDDGEPGDEDQDNDGDGFTPAMGDCDDADAGVNPDAADRPDGNYRDTNCDGVDGDIDNSVFVALSGSNSQTCTIQEPCRTIQWAIDRANALGRSDVLVSIGTYTEQLTLQSNVNVYGSYWHDWAQRGPAFEVIVTGGSGSSPFNSGQEPISVLAADVTGVELGDLTIRGVDAIGQFSDRRGRSTYAVLAHTSEITIVRSRIIAGDAANGAAGAAGTDASQSRAPDGHNGGAGGQFNTVCDDDTRGGGGLGAMNSGQPETRGGEGGRGGTMDTFCNPPFEFDFDARSGFGGFSAAVFATNSFGYGGFGGSPCSIGQPGHDGRVIHGSNGGAASTFGSRFGEYWRASVGNAGSLGANGGGGGGGGGSGGCDTGTDSYGAGGGGGGAGGLRAPTAGQGGGGGGSSFGIYAAFASVTLDNTTIERGRGGDGGQGGRGGNGQPGGFGGLGGSSPVSDRGGDGGDGGRGGSSGAGSGGAGGMSAGIGSVGSAVFQTGVTIFGSNGGNGGLGGLSSFGLPNAPSGPGGATGTHIAIP